MLILIIMFILYNYFDLFLSIQRVFIPFKVEFQLLLSNLSVGFLWFLRHLKVTVGLPPPLWTPIGRRLRHAQRPRGCFSFMVVYLYRLLVVGIKTLPSPFLNSILIDGLNSIVPSK